MPHRFVLPLLLLPAALSAGTLNPERLREVGRVLETAVAKGQPPGAVLWLEHQGQSQTWVQGARALRPAREAMTLDTVFDAASLTKVVATTPAILQLVELGRLELEAPVRRYLPEFAGDGRDRIRLRHLLTHTSGLKPGLPKEPPVTDSEDAIRRALQSLPETPPDSRFRYSDLNFILLGEIVRRVGGEPLDVFAGKHLFTPLQMTSTRFRPPADWQARVAPTETDEVGTWLRGAVHDPTARRMGGVAGHAGLFTTAADLARFARMLLGGGQLEGVRVLQESSVRLMSRVQTPATLRDRRGLGWDIDSTYSRPRGRVFPLGSFGHTGFTGTSLWIDSFSQTFVVFLSSRLHAEGGGSVRDLYEQLGTAAAQAVDGFDFQRVAGALPPRRETEVPGVLNGIDVLQRDGFAPLQGLRVGLITNQTGINAARASTIDLLAAAPGVKLRALFSPEHGIRGALDQEKIGDSKDRKTGLPIHSLYGERRAPTAAQLAELDALVFDIQDIGCRFYTYISTLRLALEAAAKAGKRFIVLDRINPIGGEQVEGPVAVDQDSFTATHALPLRHGLTTGELAQLLNRERGLGADLQVVPVEGWRREWLADETGLPWINPSPNMRTPAAALLYPGVGLLEFSVSVGRGTDTPFEVLGAPYVDDRRLAHELNALGLPGLRFLPVRFTPAASVFQGRECGGVRLLITDREALRPVRTGLALIATLQRLYPQAFALDKVNTLLNHRALLERFRRGDSWQDLAAQAEAEAAAFRDRRAAFLRY